MSISYKQKEQSKEALSIIENWSLDEFMNNKDSIDTSNPFINKIIIDLEWIDKGIVPTNKEEYYNWFKDNLKFINSEQNSHNFVSPDPY